MGYSQWNNGSYAFFTFGEAKILKKDNGSAISCLEHKHVISAKKIHPLASNCPNMEATIFLVYTFKLQPYMYLV